MTNILEKRDYYQPLSYPWAFEMYRKQLKLHWIPDEVPMQNDITDWKHNLTPAEKNLLMQIFRFFTTADVGVARGYCEYYLPHLAGQPEVAQMMSTFASFECFDKETELLTAEGWKNVTLLSSDDLLAQYTIGTEEITFAKPTKLHKYLYNGMLHHYKGRSCDLMVTPNHDIIVKHPISKKVKKVKSETGVWGGNYSSPRAGKAAGGDSSLSYLERLLIAVQADGTLRGNCPSAEGRDWRTVDVHIKKDRKIERLKHILTCCGIAFTERQKVNGFSVFTFCLPEEINIKDIKNFQWVDFVNWNEVKCSDFIAELLLWDGSSGRYWYNTNKAAVDVVQAVSTLGNIKADLSINRPAGSEVLLPQGGTTSNTKTCYVVSFDKNPWETYPYRQEVEYSDFVYCVTVPTGCVISRRNGKVVITGNSIHVEAYALLLNTLGIAEGEFKAFTEYKEMLEKHEYMSNMKMDTLEDKLRTIAIYSGFGEGLQLFSSFAILMNFPRFGKMKGMGQIVTWSIRDECYSDDTEILTQSGWKLFKELQDTDTVAQFDKDTREVSFIKPKRIVSYDVDKNLTGIRYTHTPVDFLVTPHHRTLVYKDGKPEVIEAQNLKPHFRLKLPVAGYAKGTRTLTPIERVFIAIQADGSIPKGEHRNGNYCGYRRVNIDLKKQRKIDRMTYLLQEARLEYDVVDTVKPSKLFRVNVPVPVSKSFKDWVDLSSVSAEWADAFLEELVHWDGSIRKDTGGYYYSTTDADNADMVQAIAALGGWSTSRNIQVDNRKETYKNVHRISFSRQDVLPLRTGTKTESVPYKGKVWCVEVDTGFVIVRRNNRVCVSGNTIHCEGMLKLFRTLVEENPHVWTDELKGSIYEACRRMVELEDKFIDLAFAQGGIEGLDKSEVKEYIRYIADRRLLQMGLKPNFKVKENPLMWLEEMLNSQEHANFFEARVTEYQKAALTGDWNDVWSK